MRAIGVEFVFGAGSQICGTPGRQLTAVSHTDRRINIGAQAAENTCTQIEGGVTRAVRVRASDGARRTDSHRGPRILPVGTINFRASAQQAELRARLRLAVALGYYACGETFAKNVKHVAW